MSKSVRLETREARRKLAAQHEPYWRSVGKGVAIGYRRGTEGAQWYVRKFNGGGYHKRALGDTDDEHPADGQHRLSWSDALRLALDEPRRAADLKLRYTVREAFEGYFRHREARTRSAESLATDQGKAADFIKRFGDRYLSDLDTAELQAWRDSLVAGAASPKENREGDRPNSEAEIREAKRRAQATVNRSWSVIRAGLNWSFTTGRVDSDLAWRRVKPFRDVDKPRLRFLSQKEAMALLKGSAADFRPLAHAALATGLRLGELTRLTVANVHGGRLEVPEGKGKSRTVHLTDEAERVFAQFTRKREGAETVFLDDEGRPWTRPKVSRRMAAASKAAKLMPPATFHDLRRSFGSLLANAGAQDAIIASALGHADTRMTRRHYAHLLESVVAKEVEDKLPSFGPVARAKPKARAKR